MSWAVVSSCIGFQLIFIQGWLSLDLFIWVRSYIAFATLLKTSGIGQSLQSCIRLVKEIDSVIDFNADVCLAPLEALALILPTPHTKYIYNTFTVHVVVIHLNRILGNVNEKSYSNLWTGVHIVSVGRFRNGLINWFFYFWFFYPTIYAMSAMTAM